MIKKESYGDFLLGLFDETVEKKLSRWRSELIGKLFRISYQRADTFLARSVDNQEVIILHGSVHVIVGFAVDEEDGEGYVTIDSPLVFLPKDNLSAFL